MQKPGLESAPKTTVEINQGRQGIDDPVHNVYIEFVGQPGGQPGEPGGTVDDPVDNGKIKRKTILREPLYGIDNNCSVDFIDVVLLFMSV